MLAERAAGIDRNTSVSPVCVLDCGAGCDSVERRVSDSRGMWAGYY